MLSKTNGFIRGRDCVFSADAAVNMSGEGDRIQMKTAPLLRDQGVIKS